MIVLNDVLIASYFKASGKWNFNGINSGNDDVESLINNYIAKTDAVLKNHYDALLILCQKHGMVDKNNDDEPNITPEADN